MSLAVGDMSPENRNRSFREGEDGWRGSSELRSQRRPIRIRRATVRVRLPLVLLAAERDPVHWTGERAIARRGSIVKREPHGVGIFLVFVDNHQSPLAIG